MRKTNWCDGALDELAYDQRLGNHRFADHAANGEMTRIKDRHGWMAKGRLAAMEVGLTHANAKATELEPIITEIRAAVTLQAPGSMPTRSASRGPARM